MKDMTIERAQRHIDQHYEMAGCARQDGDKEDEARHYAEIDKLKQWIKENS